MVPYALKKLKLKGGDLSSLTKKELSSLAVMCFLKEAPTGSKAQVVITVAALREKHPNILQERMQAIEASDALEALEEEAEVEQVQIEAAEAAGVLEISPPALTSEFVQHVGDSMWRYKIGEQVEVLFTGYGPEDEWCPCIVKGRRNEMLSPEGKCDGYKVTSPLDTPENDVWETKAYPARGMIRRPGETKVCNAGCRIAGQQCNCDAEPDGNTLSVT